MKDRAETAQERGAVAQRPPARRAAILAAVLPGAALALLGPGAVEGRVYLTQEQALRLAFGEGAQLEREVFFLTEAQLARARELAGPGIRLESALLTRYRGSRGGQLAGWAYFDTHAVRTLQQTLMIVVAPDGGVARVEIVAFLEPEEYLPKRRWLEQFSGRRLDGRLDLFRGIHGITGATLSARAVTDATRRVLALHAAVGTAPPRPGGQSR